jgi:hypothetical protein
MQVTRIQNEKSVSEIVARVYGIKSDDSRAAAAEKALLAANPHLKDPRNLPTGTPVVVPEIPGLHSRSTATSDPKGAVWAGVLDKLFDSAQQGSNAQATGQATPPEKSTYQPRSRALTQLEKDIAQFKKLHTS